MARELDQIDRRLLDEIQGEVPLHATPFQALGERVGLTEAEVLERLRRLKTAPQIIRQISAIFDSKSLGYRSTLVAARVDEHRLDEAATIINRHPGVSHNYRRNNSFNLWYTLAVPPDSQLGLEGTVGRLHAISGARSTRMLPTLKLFKIGVKFDLTGGSGEKVDAPAFAQEEQDRAAGYQLTDIDQRIIRVLQQDLPLVPRPFDIWARQAEVRLDQLLDLAALFKRQHRMRRFAAVLRHREVGFSANGMGVWNVPAHQQETFGQTAARFSAVSHCYLRPSYPDWPYCIFTMVHAPTEDQCRQVVRSISDATGVSDYDILFSTHEYKKTRVKYFEPDTLAWEAEQRSAMAPVLAS